MQRAQIADAPSRTRLWLVLSFALVFPLCFTAIYFEPFAKPAGEDQHVAPLAVAVYFGGKIIQFSLPVVWLLLADRRRIAWKWPAAADGAWGLATGLLIGGGMLALFYGGLAETGPFLLASGRFHAKLAQMGVVSRPHFIAVSLFYILLHSLLEEYYWRWFVFGQLRRLVPFGAAVSISSLGFMAHHVVLLKGYLPWSWALVCSAGVAVGGALWAGMYQRSGSIWGPWLSHLLVDAAIFAIAYQLAFG